MHDADETERSMRFARRSKPTSHAEIQPRRFDLLYANLHERAKLLMREQRPDHTLQATALLNEAWLRLRDDDAEHASATHFVRRVTRAMRTILIDHARGKAADKRGGGAPTQAADSELPAHVDSKDTLLALREALERLGAVDADLARVAAMRIVGGLEHREVARILGVSTRTVERAWVAARAWLQHALEDAPGNG